jgi:ABC-2 type transport system ATP-binding protein
MESAAIPDERATGAGPRAGRAVPAVQLVAVEKAYGVVRPRAALRGVSLRIEPGQCYGLAGRNGAGKTTLIKVMLGLVAPDDGQMRLFGVRPDLAEVRRRVGFVPEAAELPRGASPLQLVRRWARLRGVPVRAAVAQGEGNLRRLGLGELLLSPAHRFSKGEKQRTLFALALLGQPELLVLDEPTDGLDPLGRALVRKVILEECAAGRTVFINSHLLSETERVCTRVGILRDGLLVREEVLGETAGGERATSALTLESPLDGALQADLRARPPARDPGSACVYLIEHDDLDDLNRAIDRVRAAGVRVVEVRRVRRDLEETFAEVAQASANEVALPPSACSPSAGPCGCGCHEAPLAGATRCSPAFPTFRCAANAATSGPRGYAALRPPHRSLPQPRRWNRRVLRASWMR